MTEVLYHVHERVDLCPLDGSVIVWVLDDVGVCADQGHSLLVDEPAAPRFECPECGGNVQKSTADQVTPFRAPPEYFVTIECARCGALVETFTA